MSGIHDLPKGQERQTLHARLYVFSKLCKRTTTAGQLQHIQCNHRENSLCRDNSLCRKCKNLLKSNTIPHNWMLLAGVTAVWMAPKCTPANVHIHTYVRDVRFFKFPIRRRTCGVTSIPHKLQIIMFLMQITYIIFLKITLLGSSHWKEV